MSEEPGKYAVEPTWTKEELSEFDILTRKVSSPYQMDRIEARLFEMPRFVKKHGLEKCDAMFKVLVERDKARERGEGDGEEA